MPRGGKRQGVQGAAYSNRTDLNAGPRIDAPRGQPYGEAGAQIAAQQALPMSAPPPSAIPLGAPTNRPNEPVQAGLPIGPGPGPEAAGIPSPDPVEMTLRGLYEMYPNRDLAELLEDIDRGVTF